MGDVDSPPGMVLAELETSVVASNSGMLPTAPLADLLLMSDTSPMVDAADLPGQGRPRMRTTQLKVFRRSVLSMVQLIL